MSYVNMEDDGSSLTYPIWERFEGKNIDDMNDQLIRDIRYLNDLDISELTNDRVMPDTSLLISKLSMEKGLSGHLQVNNVRYENYHRDNGDTFAHTTIGDKSTAVVFPTESAIGVFNLVSNMHFQHIFQNDFVNIVSMVSQTVDGNNIDEILNSLLALVCTILFPISLCLGFPIMLYVLTMEKEEKIKSLLEINGLNPKAYWFSFFIYYFIVLEFTVLLWLLIGKTYIQIDFFQQASIGLSFWVLTVWNINQISLSMIVSSFMKDTRNSTLIGYQGSIFMILFISIVSQFLFPNPGHLPYFF